MQVRAARTREAIIRGAAECIDAQGYRGASLAAICRSSAVSVGALVFHFRDKSGLAEAVVEAGSATARAVAEAAAREDDSPLHAVGTLLCALTVLLREDVVVRAGALLARERPDIAARWHDAWTPRLTALVAQADTRGELAPGAEPGLVTALADHLLTAAESRRPGQRPDLDPDPDSDPGQEITRLWALVQHGIARRST
ncbi:TetR family transcriptional regulator [Streptomyces antibioticus]|uniref:helix-turn-helix domain-containing protein n=1 Tax=Streptomyces antibioticus TaxID=1890 RepID=UPI0033BA31AB